MSSVASLLSGTPAACAPVVAVAQGAATIPLGGSTIAVANTAIKATSIVVAMINEAAQDATCKAVCVRLIPGTGFAIDGQANATAAVDCQWAILKL
jgi:hypothetical protein